MFIALLIPPLTIESVTKLIPFDTIPIRESVIFSITLIPTIPNVENLS